MPCKNESYCKAYNALVILQSGDIIISVLLTAVQLLEQNQHISSFSFNAKAETLPLKTIPGCYTSEMFTKSRLYTIIQGNRKYQ